MKGKVQMTMLILTMRNEFKVGDTRQAPINGVEQSVTWQDDETLVVGGLRYPILRFDRHEETGAVRFICGSSPDDGKEWVSRYGQVQRETPEETRERDAAMLDWLARLGYVEWLEIDGNRRHELTADGITVLEALSAALEWSERQQQVESSSDMPKPDADIPF
jgi:hypothetical protein